MTVRLKLALTVIATGLLTALGVIAAVLYAFERFEHETTFARANAFLGRVTAQYDDLLDLQQRQPEEFRRWLRGLVLYEPDTQLYLLDAQGTVLATSGDAELPPGFKVAIGPVQEAAAVAQGRSGNRYVMGDDPERMDDDAVIAARPVQRATIRNEGSTAGYLYLVCHKAALPASRWEAVRNSLALPALALIAGIVALTTLFAGLIIAAVTRPLQRLTDAVSTLSARGLDEGLTATPRSLLPPAGRDEFGRLTEAFSMMLATLQRQWAALRRLDHFRREGVSNLSHDLRSPLTATAACLETLQTRWRDDPARVEEAGLVEVALRNARNAARLVQSLGDLARLDEPSFALRRESVDAGELLDDIALRFADRAARQGVALAVDHAGDSEPPFASLDIELIERAVANLVDNALKFCPAGARVVLAARATGGQLEVSVRDSGPGIAAEDLPHLFDRFYQVRQSVAPATGEGGKGLGLAIVKRIAELHGGAVTVDSSAGGGMHVHLWLPRQSPAAPANGAG
ncbi:HAMP domain-containing sensor histidine kinase [uncultured Piscinibacter sp.]|uniref:sensor histidine kinase n=1 Tax=uncultured Piscinibacter sp. TaxID=1131835 RepID=UPI0026025A24|nr:HAMP domain-containing sensor histidine kinase [uncultured Piscinibacter sp.]